MFNSETKLQIMWYLCLAGYEFDKLREGLSSTLSESAGYLDLFLLNSAQFSGNNGKFYYFLFGEVLNFSLSYQN